METLNNHKVNMSNPGSYFLGDSAFSLPCGNYPNNLLNRAVQLCFCANLRYHNSQ